jgi:signal transduction histidine kinase/DNA-binding response OmpR family regulator
MPSESKVNILLVDDQPGNLLALQAVLDDLGENLVLARSGREALRCLLHDDFALILLDVHMPDMDGLETAALIRERDRTRHVPIIFLTGYEQTDVQMFKGYSLGAVDYLTKPLVPEVLRSKVTVFVELYRKTQELRRNQEREHERRLQEERQRWEMERLRQQAEREKRVNEELARLQAEVAAQLADMTQLHQLSARLSATLDLPAVLQEVLHGILGLTHAEHGVLLLHDREGDDLSPAAGYGLGNDYLRELGRVPAGAGVHGAALARRETVIVEDVEAGTDWAADRPAARRAGFRAACAVPLLTRGGTSIGTVVAYYPTPHRPRERAVRLAELYARQAAQAVDNARLYAEIQEANRGKDEFLAMLAHELRNPLAPVLHSLHVLRLGGEPRAVELARDMIERQVRHMTRLIDDLLDVSRITRGKIRLQKRTVELAEVVGRAVDSSRPLIESRDHHLDVTLPHAPVHLVADPTRLEQVFANLLNNAAKYTEPGGLIRLSAECRGREAVVRVRDTGIGIPPQLLPRVFELFMQAHQNLDRAQGGLGIGLTLVRTLVEMHGGRVEAHSAGPGNGSEFAVHLPLPEEVPEPVAEANPAGPPALAPLRVLVVDDNRDAAESLAMLLRLDGHEVRLAHDGPAALDAAGDFRPEVVLLDIGLPGMSGHDVARRLHGGHGGAPPLLVAMTGYGQEEDRRRSREAGFDHHLVKPVDPQVLRQLLART